MIEDFYGSDLSHIHHLGFGDFARDSAPGILQALRDAGIHEGRLLDVGCGSGILTRRLLDAGYAVTGIDISPAMVDLARRNAPEAEYRVGAAGIVDLPPCEGIVAIGEVLAYQSEGMVVDLPALFARFAKVLRPGGILIFDILLGPSNEPMAYAVEREGEHWRVRLEVAEDGERSEVTRRIHTEMDTAGGVRQSDELHRVRTFDSAVVVRWLEAAGFSVTTGSAYGDHPLLNRRLAFFARRQQAAQGEPFP